jgi:hypothetical protein
MLEALAVVRRNSAGDFWRSEHLVQHRQTILLSESTVRVRCGIAVRYFEPLSVSEATRYSSLKSRKIVEDFYIL